MVFLVWLITLIVLVILYRKIAYDHQQLRERVDELNRRLSRLESGSAAESVPEAPPPSVETAVVESVPSLPPKPVQETTIGPAERSQVETESAGLEERVGAQLFVWIGAIALALAGIFLVKYSFERGWISPPVRVLLALLFGILLLIAGEWMRLRSNRISQALTGAGIADLYASVLAAFHLYHLIGTAAGFVFLCVITGLAVLLSLRSGPFIAVLGLLGGFFTPSWIGAQAPGTLFSYLLLLQLGLLMTSRSRRWWALAILTLLGISLWTLFWLLQSYDAQNAYWVRSFLMISTALFLIGGLRKGENGAWGNDLVTAIINWGAILVALLLMGFLTQIESYHSVDWIFLGILAAGGMTLSWKRPAYYPLAWLAFAQIAGLLMIWASKDPSGHFLQTLFFMGILFSAGSYALFWKGGFHWSLLSALSAVMLFLIAYWGRSEADVQWSLWALALAGLFAVASYPVAQRRSKEPRFHHSLAAYTSAAAAFLSLAVPFYLEEEAIAVAWSLETAALVWLAFRLQLPVLHLLARILAAIVVIRLLFFSEATPVWQWILYVYGVPSSMFIASAVLTYRNQARRAQLFFQTSSLILSFVLISLLTRQLFQPGRLWPDTFEFAEWGALSIAWLGFAAFTFFTQGRYALSGLSWFGHAVVFLTLSMIIGAQLLLVNPLFAHKDVGSSPLWNLLLINYGLPALLLGGIAAQRKRAGEILFPTAYAGFCLILTFALLNLEIRQAYHGNFLDGSDVYSSEKYVYSVAWVLFGTLLLVGGIIRKNMFFRYGSLIVMFLAVGKVFLYDIEHLTDLYKVLSFLGLGICLLLLGYLYQRFVFTGRKAASGL